MNAETRAKELRGFIDGELRFKGQWRTLDGTLDTVEALIATAITRAENDKLEEAAAWLDNRAAFYSSRAEEAIDAEHAAERMFGSEACANAAAHTRSLKSDG